MHRRVLGLVFAAQLVALPGSAQVTNILINNGLDCSNPDNVIDHGHYSDLDHFVYVRNDGCPPSGPPDDPCPAPGDATQVCIESGGFLNELQIYDSSGVTFNGGLSDFSVVAYDSSSLTINSGGGMVMAGTGSSTVTMNGGGVTLLEASPSSTVTINDGQVGDFSVSSPAATINGGAVEFVESYLSGVVRINGGTALVWLKAFESSSIVLTGTGFAADGSPVPYGDLSAQTGTLTGTLASGDSIDCVFYQGGADCDEIWPCTGTITLAAPPLPVPVLSLSGKLLLAAVLVGVVAMRKRGLR